MDGGPAPLTVHDLPPELLEVIFTKLREADLITVQNVCLRWSEIVDKRVGRRVYVGNASRKLRWKFTNSTKVRIEELSQIGVQSCYIFKRPDLTREEEIEEEMDSEAEDELEEDPMAENQGGESEEELEDEGNEDVENEEPENEDEWEDEEEENAELEIQDPLYDDEWEDEDFAEAENFEESDEDDGFESSSDDDDFEAPDEDSGDWYSPLVGELKYPYLLRKLDLHGSLPPGFFTKLVTPAINLSVLEITLFTLTQLKNEDLESLLLPNLKALSLDEYKLNCENKYWDNDEDNFLPNLNTLLTKSQFPRLTSFKIDMPPTSFVDLNTTRTLVNFVQDHYALRRVHLQMYYNKDIEDNAMPEGDPATHCDLRSIIDGIRKRGKCHLRELTILIITEESHPNHQFLGPIEIIKEFLVNVSSLESLLLRLDPIPSSTLQTICEHNSSTLRQMNISSDHSKVDCSVFASLQNVKSMFVESLHGIDGITQLPACLTNIHLVGPILQQSDANHILFDLPNMEMIFLSGMGGEPVSPTDISCVTLDMLKRFNENRRVRSLFVRGECLVNPESFPAEGIPNGDPTNPKMLQVRTEDSKYLLIWELNRNGFYHG